MFLQYYTKALATPLGQKVKQFYTVADKQVRDIHEEARRIADNHKASSQSQPSAEQHGTANSVDPTTPAAPAA